MKKTKRLIWILAVLLIALTVIVPSAAQAAIDDFDITFSVTPELTGYLGGDIQLRISVENKGTTPITWIEVDVLTQEPFHERRSITIPEGTTRHNLLFIVPFWGGDLDSDRLLSVSMNNDGDASSDGVQVRTFAVEGTEDILGVERSTETTGGDYAVLPGDTLTITHTFSNPFETHSALGLDTRIYLWRGGENIYASPTDSHGALLPGESTDTTLIYSIAPSDIGHIQVMYRAAFTLMGRPYVVLKDSFAFNVMDPAPDIEFDAHLSASSTTVDAGDDVLFSIRIENTGENFIEEMVVLNSEEGLISTLGGLPVGGSVSVESLANITETADFNFIVVCRAGLETVESIETNTVHITVLEPEESSTQIPTEIPSVEIEPTPSPTFSDIPAVEADAVPKEAVADDSAIAAKANDRSDLPLYIIIGVLGLIVLAGAITLLVILKKRKKKTSEAKQEEKDE